MTATLNNKILDGMKILSTDPDTRIGVYAIRYLGQAGANVNCIGTRGTVTDPMGFYSKYTYKKIYLNSDNFDQLFRSFIVNNGNNYDFINPINVAKMITLIKLDDELNLGLRYLLPRQASLQIADDKERIVEHAEKIGVSCPRTFSRVRESDLENPGKLGITFPCIIKFRGDQRTTHWHPEDRYKIVYEQEQLISSYREMHAVESYPIIQDYIEGVGVGFFALYDKNKKIKAQFCHQRVREYPITGGPSSCCTSIYNETLIKIGRTLLESLDWVGLAMVEFKYDRNRNKFYLLEINPRYWGSMPLAVHSGVNFPVLHALAAHDVNFEPVLEYKSGVITRFIDKDIKAIISMMRTEKKITNKMRLFLSLFNPYVREGFLKPDDFGMFCKMIWSKYTY
jgi:predicted ATP-grasp superfamily ATP-dependent carboligase